MIVGLDAIEYFKTLLFGIANSASPRLQFCKIGTDAIANFY